MKKALAALALASLLLGPTAPEANAAENPVAALVVNEYGYYTKAPLSYTVNTVMENSWYGVPPSAAVGVVGGADVVCHGFGYTYGTVVTERTLSPFQMSCVSTSLGIAVVRCTLSYVRVGAVAQTDGRCDLWDGTRWDPGTAAGVLLWTADPQGSTPYPYVMRYRVAGTIEIAQV